MKEPMYDHVIKQINSKEILYGLGCIDHSGVVRSTKLYQFNMNDKTHTCIETHLNVLDICSPLQGLSLVCKDSIIILGMETVGF